MNISKRIDKIELIKKFLESKNLPKSLWYDLYKFADFEYSYNEVIWKEIAKCDLEFKDLKQQSREVGAKLRDMRNNGNTRGWLYPLIKQKQRDVIVKMSDVTWRKNRLVKTLQNMEKDARQGYYSNTYDLS